VKCLEGGDMFRKGIKCLEGDEVFINGWCLEGGEVHVEKGLKY